MGIAQIALDPPTPNTNGHLLDFWGGPIACQDAEGFLVKFGGEIGTLYQIFTPCKNAF